MKILPNFLSVLLLALWILVVHTAYGQDTQAPLPPSPIPPTSIISEARRVAQLRGIVLASTPDKAEVETDAMGRHKWDLQWWRPEGLVGVHLDEQTNQALSFYNSVPHEACDAAYERGDTPNVTYATAMQALDTVFAEINPPSGDWQIDPILSSSQTTPTALIAAKQYWNLTKAIYRDGVIARELIVSVSVSPFTGEIMSWAVHSSASFSTTTPAYVGWEFASNTAKDAAAQYWGLPVGTTPYFTSPPSAANLVWLPISDTSTLNGLFYHFTFTQESSPPLGAEQIAVEIDTVSGEVTYCGPLRGIGAGGGGNSKYKQRVPSPRRKLIMAMLNKPKHGLEHDPMMLALLGGKPVPAIAPSRTARQFTRQVDGKPVSFGFNAGARRLTWQVGPKQWAGVAVAKPDADALLADLNRAHAAR